MTVCGFVITRGGDAYLWADSEQYLNGMPMGGAIEKTATSRGGLVGVSTGHSPLTAKVRRAIAGLDRAGFADALRRLPHELRRACAEARAHFGAAYEVDLTVGMVGPAEGEMRGVVLAESAGFEPSEASAWLSPAVGGAPPATATEILAVAQAQLRLIRARHYPGATGKTLTVARVGATGIARRSVPLLIGDERR
jgi:hypothetical protein